MNTTVGTSSITVQWVAPAIFDSYVVVIEEDGSEIETKDVDSTETETTFNTNLDAATEYTIRLRSATLGTVDVASVISDDITKQVYTRKYILNYIK